MKLPMVVYIIKNEVTGKIYVGRSSNLKVRVQQHMNLLRRGMHPVEDMQADFDEYGDHFRVIVIDKIETYGDRSKEGQWQKRLNTLDRRYGYNYRDPLIIHYGRKKASHT